MTPGIKRMRFASLYSGIGAGEEGLKRAGVPHELVCFAETDDASALSYSLLHGVSINKNWKDVAYIDGKSLKNLDMILHRASHKADQMFTQIWETVRVIEESLPKVVVWESLPDIVSKGNVELFEGYLNALGKAGYRSYYKIMNSHNHGSAQKRRRMVVVSLRKDVKGDFLFPADDPNPKKLMEYLEEEVGSKFTVPLEVVDTMVLDLITQNNKIFYSIRNSTEKGYLEAQEGDGIDWGFPGSTTRRGRVQVESCHTLTTACSLGTIHNKIPRFFTPKEYWRLQGFKDKQFATVTKYGLSNDQLYRQAGNAMNVDVSKVLFKALKEQGFI